MHQHFLLLLFAHIFPFPGRKRFNRISSSVNFGISMNFKVRNKFFNRFRLLCFSVIPRFEQLYECPLCPFIILRITCSYFAVPVVRETYFIKLFAISFDVLVGCFFGMSSGLYGILFRWQTVSVITHRVQHIKSSMALVPRINIRSYIS